MGRLCLSSVVASMEKGAANLPLFARSAIPQCKKGYSMLRMLRQECAATGPFPFHTAGGSTKGVVQPLLSQRPERQLGAVSKEF